MSLWRQTSWTDAELAEVIAKTKTLIGLMEERPAFFGEALLCRLRVDLCGYEGYQRARKERP